MDWVQPPHMLQMLIKDIYIYFYVDFYVFIFAITNTAALCVTCTCVRTSLGCILRRGHSGSVFLPF